NHIWGNGMEYENPLVVTLDDKLIYHATIGGEADMKAYDQVQSGAMDKVNARLKNIKFQTTAGPHRIGVTFERQSLAVRRSVAGVRDGRRARSLLSREFLPTFGAVRCQGRQCYPEPQYHPDLQSGEG